MEERQDLPKFAYEPPSGYCEAENMDCGGEDPIDQKLRKAIEADSCTNAEIQAQQVALDEWTHALEESCAAFPESESGANVWRAWQDFVRLEFERIEALYGKLLGTMYRPMMIAAKVAVMRERCLQLRDDLALLKENA